MTETSTDNGALGMWSTDQCPFTIEYSRKALDDIRLAVVDAFFSLPRGGAEIGGILLGKIEEHRIQILDYAPIECEHAYGPAFTLSEGDQARLGETLGQSFPGGLRPVGWYHSHTRTEISLSEADLDIYNRYFPERWQVALVLRPSTLQPTQAGFFFREPDGSIQAQTSYQEFVVEALPLHPVSAGGPQAVPGPMRETEPEAVVMTLQAPDTTRLLAAPPEVQSPQTETPARETAPPVAAMAHEPEPVIELDHQPTVATAMPAELPPVAHSEPRIGTPNTYDHQPEHHEFHQDGAQAHVFAADNEGQSEKKVSWLGIAAGILAGVALGVAGDQIRSHAQIAPHAAAVTQQAPAPGTAAVRKQNEDLARQVSNLTQQNATLRKQLDELSKQQADSAKQQTELTRQQTELAKQQGEAGKMQAELKQQRDDLIKQTTKLKADLSVQTARAQSLQQQLEDLRRQQQRRRLSIQSSDTQP